MKRLDALLTALIVIGVGVLVVTWAIHLGPGGVATLLGVGPAYAGVGPMLQRLLGAFLVVFSAILLTLEAIPFLRRLAAAPAPAWAKPLNRILATLVFGIAGTLALAAVARTNWAAGVDLLGVGEGYTTWWDSLVKLAAVMLVTVTGTTLLRRGWSWVAVHLLGRPEPRQRIIRPTPG